MRKDRIRNAPIRSDPIRNAPIRNDRVRSETVRRAATAVLLVAAVLMITGCAPQDAAPDRSGVESRTTATPRLSGQPSPSGQQPSPFPSDLPSGVPRGLTTAQATVDRKSADAVAEAFVVRLELVDTRLDRRPNDAARRAAAYATPRLRGQLLSGEPVGPAGVRWTELVQHHGWSTVSSQLGGIGEDPPTTATRATRAVTPIPTDHGTDGWTSHPDPPGTYIVVLNRDQKGAIWAVSGYTIQ